MFPCINQMVADMVSDDKNSQAGNDNNTVSTEDTFKPVPLIKYDDAKELESYFSTELSVIPDAILKKAAVEVAFPFDWDALSTSERYHAFVRHFRGNHPQEWKEFYGAFPEACDIQKIVKQIEELTIKTPQTVTEHINKTEKLEKLQGQLEKANMIFEKKAKKTPEEIVKELRLQMMEDWEIAGVLQQTHNLSTFQIGTLLPANQGTSIAPASVSKRGYNLLKSYKNKNVDLK